MLWAVVVSNMYINVMWVISRIILIGLWVASLYPECVPKLVCLLYIVVPWFGWANIYKRKFRTCAHISVLDLVNLTIAMYYHGSLICLWSSSYFILLRSNGILVKFVCIGVFDALYWRWHLMMLSAGAFIFLLLLRHICSLHLIVI